MSDPDNLLQQHIATLYQTFRETNVVDLRTVEPVAHLFFSKHMDDADVGLAADRFFGAFGKLWQHFLQRGLYDRAEHLWKEVIDLARRWEAQNTPRLVHKGLPFYFWGGTAIQRGNIRKGFILLHAALEEDARKHYRQDADPAVPSLYFVTLDSRADDQFLRDLVQVGADEVARLLAAYRADTGSTLQFADFQNRYARQFDVREMVFIFTLSIFEAVHMRECLQDIGAGNDFGSQLCADCLFNLCQVIEESIRVKNPRQGAFFDQATYVSQQCGWSLAENPLGYVNQQRKVNFDATVRSLLDNTIVVGTRGPIPLLERSLWIVYTLRNATAHSIASRAILQERFDDLYRCTLYTLFNVVDALY